MFATVYGSTLLGIDAHPVMVEVHLGTGLPGFDIVGLAEAAVRESRVRVRAAIANSGFALAPRHVVLNLAPADLRKHGAALDLAIAIAVLAANGACSAESLRDLLLVGELSLTGDLAPTRGALAHLRAARTRGISRTVLPLANAAEASLAGSPEARVASTLREVIEWLDGRATLRRAVDESPPLGNAPRHAEDLGEVRGQEGARRALEVAASGAHNLLFVGPPGAGKTMLARRLPTILPEPSLPELIDIATIAGASTHLDATQLSALSRPFRAPHHTASSVAMVGGGDPIRPGEVTLAHNGVLFLDELPEFARSSIEALRTTMELGVAVVARARQRATMPAKPIVVAAMNPCPCGYAGDKRRVCTCSPERIENYRTRLSGPLLDRFDMHVQLPPVVIRALRKPAHGETSSVVRARVAAAREFRRARELSRQSPERDTIAELSATATSDALALLDHAAEALGLSARGYVKVLRVARTIADMGQVNVIDEAHVAEAVQYRVLDRREPHTLQVVASHA